MTHATGSTELPEVDVWLLDGFNVLHAVVLGGEDRGRFWDAAQRDRLIERLGAGTPGGVPIVVVFDGEHPVQGEAARPSPGLEVVFAPSADDWIVRRARRAAAGDAGGGGGGGAGGGDRSERVGVVSSDRKVAGRCRHAGAVVVAPSAFMARLLPSTGDRVASDAAAPGSAAASRNEGAD